MQFSSFLNRGSERSGSTENAVGIRPTEAMLACEEELRSLAALAAEARSDTACAGRILYVAVAEHKRFPVE